jgi:hypothetical protein
MAYIDLTFTGSGNTIKNTSAQVGDNVYYVNTSTSGGFTTGADPVEMGTIKSITSSTSSIVVTVNVNSDLVLPTTDSFIFFNKEELVNVSSLKGYYGEAKFKNNSTSKAELFSTSCEVSQSSK